MNRDQALQKIKKCLALGRSADTHEAAAAMRQAQKLMAEYQVSERELSLVDVREVSARAVTPGGSIWDNLLVNAVSETFGCEVYSQTVGRYNSAANYVRTRSIVFVGTDAAPDVAVYAYEVLGRQCAKARLAHIAKQPRNCKPITKTARGDEFANGWVLAVRQLVEAFAPPDRDQALLLEYMEAKHPNLETRKARDTTKGRKVAGHQWAGYQAGGQAKLDRGIGASAPQGLLA